MSGAVADVVVVGGGPAGAAFAARMASAGRSVVLLDREVFPRPKPCGDCVNPAAVGELAALGVLAAVRGEPHARLEGWTIVPPGGAALAFHGSFPDGCGGMAISRERLDRVLLEHAARVGAEVRCGVRVVDLRRARGGAVQGVRTADGADVAARLVVGADGLRSVVLRRLGLVRRPPRLRKLALTAHVAGVGGLDGRGELHVLPRGTLGIAPLGDGLANVTVVVAQTEAGAVAGDREGYYDRFLRDSGRLDGAARVGPVRATGPFDWSVRRASADGALLIGDAAGYFDPFTGQGIYRALRGATLGAEVAMAALAVGDLSAARLAEYERARRRAFGPGAALQRLIEQVTSHERLMGLAASRLRRRPELADALVAVTGDLRPVRSLLTPRLLAMVVA